MYRTQVEGSLSGNSILFYEPDHPQMFFLMDGGEMLIEWRARTKQKQKEHGGRERVRGRPIGKGDRKSEAEKSTENNNY